MLDKLMARLAQGRVSELHEIAKLLRSSDRNHDTVKLVVTSSTGRERYSVDLTDLPYSSFARELGEFIESKTELELVSALKQAQLWSDDK